MGKKLYPEHREAARKAYQEGHYQQAIRHYHKALSAYRPAVDPPDRHLVFASLSACHLALRQHPKAIEEADRSIELCPTTPKVPRTRLEIFSLGKGYFRKAEVKLDLGDHQEAKELYQKCLSLPVSNR